MVSVISLSSWLCVPGPAFDSFSELRHGNYIHPFKFQPSPLRGSAVLLQRALVMRIVTLRLHTNTQSSLDIVISPPGDIGLFSFKSFKVYSFRRLPLISINDCFNTYLLITLPRDLTLSK